MGKAKYFFGLSLTLLVVGSASLIAHWWPLLWYWILGRWYGCRHVRFAAAPPVDQIRNGLAQQGLGNSTIVPVSDIANPERK